MSVNTYSKKTDADKKLAENFRVSEFACNDGSDKILIDSSLVNILQKIRTWAKSPVVITSAYRTPEYNVKVGGVSDSYHTRGMAADIVISGKKPLEVAAYAESIGVKGIGCYNDDLFVHVDTRSSKSFWYNQSNTPASTFSYQSYYAGTYIVRADLLNVRTGPGTNYEKKSFSSLSKNAQEQIMTIEKAKRDGYVCGMTCTVYETKNNWGRTPSGWICLDYCMRSSK